MADTQNVDEVRRQLAACEEEMKRAGERAREAVRNLHRATGIFGAPTQIDLPTAEEALAEVREAQQAYQAEANHREELRAALADLEGAGSHAGRAASAPRAETQFADALHSRASAAPPPADPAQPQTPWRAVAIAALVALAALVLGGVILAIVFLAPGTTNQPPPVPPPVTAQKPATPETPKPPKVQKASPAQKAFDDALVKSERCLARGRPMRPSRC